MSNRKEMILEFMGEKDYKPMRFKELCYILQVDEKDRDLFAGILDELLNEYKIVLTNKGRYMLQSKDVLVGEYIGNKRGFGFVRVSGMEEDFFVPEAKTMNAFNGDMVLIRVFDRKTGPRKEAEVIKVIDHTVKTVVGTYQRNDSFGFVLPDNKRIADDIFVKLKYSMGAVTGHKVVCQILNYGTKNKSPEGRIVEIIGHINDPGSDIMSVVRAYDIPVEYPEKVMDSLKDIPDFVTDTEGRRDFRGLDTVTIDGADAKDLDDAITLSFADGIYTLGVHIADVSHYVTEKSPLDREALKRGTSVYLTDRVIPMLPHKLSNGICSLNAGTDRLTLSCIMKIDEKGRVTDHEICEGVINVDERMTYTDVAAIVDNEPDAPYERYSKLVPMFHMMKELSDIIRAARRKRGSIDFDFAETKIIVDENHKPVEISEYDRNSASRIIEDFMLMANETVAEDYFWQEIPFEYRTHETPDYDKIETLSHFMRNFGLYFKVSKDKLHPKEIQKLLGRIEGEPYEQMISKITLRSMKQARYSTECTGHFGLACKYYCHFTSPIRRYPDLQIHRIIKENLHGTLDEKRISHYRRILPKVTEDNSLKERRAQDAERDVVKLKQIEYMSEHIGEEFDGIISGVTYRNIFVELENTVEGTVGVDRMTDDYYEFDESKYAMTGEMTGKSYALGDKVRIRVVSCDKLERMIEFEFVEEKRGETGAKGKGKQNNS